MHFTIKLLHTLSKIEWKNEALALIFQEIFAEKERDLRQQETIQPPAKLVFLITISILKIKGEEVDPDLFNVFDQNPDNQINKSIPSGKGEKRKRKGSGSPEKKGRQV